MTGVQLKRQRLHRTVVLVFPLPLLACRPGASISEPAPVVVAPAPAPSETPSADPVAPDDVSVRSEPAPPEENHPAGPGRIGCGASTCSASTDVCCADIYHRHYACAKRRATPSPRLFEDKGGSLDIEEPDCRDAAGDQMAPNPALWFCDGSDDCPGGEVCCKQGTNWTMCVRSRGAPGSVCEVGEACSSDGSCRSKDAICQDGVCKRARPSVSCGSAACTAAAPICCVAENERTCVTRARSSCSDLSHHPVECRGPQDCLAGQRCCVSVGAADAHCAGRCIDATPTCRSAADCRGVSISGFEGIPVDAPVCKLARYSGVRRCAMPWE